MPTVALVDLLATGRGTDPDWPPVLVALVLVVVGGAALVTVVMFRRLREAARGGTRGADPRGRGGSA